MSPIDLPSILGLVETEEDPDRIEAAYREKKRLWDGRRHNPAFRHEYLRMQEAITEAYATLRDPERRARWRAERAREVARREGEARRELAGWVRLAVDAGYLTATARQGLVEKGIALGLSEASALRVVLEVALETGARNGRPGGIDELATRRSTFRWFVEQALEGRTRRPLEPGLESMLSHLAEQFGFGAWRLSDTVDSVLAANRWRRLPDRVGRFLARLWTRLEWAVAGGRAQ